ncbi:MAG: hydrogenase maturation nickel metallochaperone HypA [Desulfovibrionaceae bacterium]|nr:hydrogenase maturation nickel metallochaperone HypA [Desulfovibrionaceae bacterium]
MHEASLAQGLLRIALETVRGYNGSHPDAPAGRIKSLKVGLGLLSCVEVTTFAGCFELLAEGTEAEGALLEVEREPLTCDCHDCHASFTLTSRSFHCPHCRSSNLSPHGGHGLTLLSLEVEQKD